MSRAAQATSLLAVLALAQVASAQGCAQCRDNTAATPPATQHAYRTAISLLALTATGLCSAVLLIGRRFR